MNTVAIIQARMASSRLLGKVMEPIQSLPVLAWVVERTRRARTVNSVVVATTTDASDEPLVAWCLANDTIVYRGSTFDVLDRVYQAARLESAQRVVRLTADCPLIDPDEIDHVCDEMLAREVDFCANRLPPPWTRSYPIGLDTEVVAMPALERTWREATQKHEREHVLPFLYQQPGRFRVYQVHTTPDYGHLRWTVDTSEDLEMIRALVALLDEPQKAGWREFLTAYQNHPRVQAINAGIAHKKYDDVDHRGSPASVSLQKGEAS